MPAPCFARSEPRSSSTLVRAPGGLLGAQHHQRVEPRGATVGIHAAASVIVASTSAHFWRANNAVADTATRVDPKVVHGVDRGATG